jgi:Tfp pilus assembly protein PilV
MLNILILVIGLTAVVLMLTRGFARGNRRLEHHQEAVVTQSSEANEATGRTIHSKTYQRGMALLTILVSAAALFAFLYFTPD